MKKILLACALCTVGFLVPDVYAQDVDINILRDTTAIEKGQTGTILVTICNVDPNEGLEAPANKLRPLISVSPIVEIVGAVNLDNSPLTNWKILSQDSESIILLNTAPLPNAECFSFYVVVKGVIESETTKVVTATLGFQGPQTPGNLTGNDNSTTGVKVSPPLPVTLVSFAAVKEGQTSLLSWSTSEEVNSDYFEVQHSTNGNQWSKVGEVKSHGESTVLHHYSFTHERPAAGDNFYRLKMVDFDETFAYSRIRKLGFDSAHMLSVTTFPNPVSDELVIDHHDWSSVTALSLFDKSGKKIDLHAQTATNVLDVSSYSSGAYVLQIAHKDGSVLSRKILIVH